MKWWVLMSYSPIGCWRDPLVVFSCIFPLVHWQFFFSSPNSPRKPVVSCSKPWQNHCGQHHGPHAQHLLTGPECLLRGRYWFWFSHRPCLLVRLTAGQNLECLSKWNRSESSKCPSLLTAPHQEKVLPSLILGNTSSARSLDVPNFSAVGLLSRSLRDFDFSTTWCRFFANLSWEQRRAQ